MSKVNDSLTPHKALQKFLMAGYAYYHRFDSLIPDEEFDSLAKYLLGCYDEFQDHQHAHLVTKGDLQAGTLYTLKSTDYPTMIRVASDIWGEDKFAEGVMRESEKKRHTGG